MTGSKTQTDAARDGRLIEAALANPADYRHLVELYQNRVYATALRISGNPSDAKDASQEAFLRAFRALERFEIGRSFGPWICTIAANVSRDQLRDPLRRLSRVADWFTGSDGSATSLLDKQKSPSRADITVDLEESRDFLAGALLNLKPKVREAVVLRFVSGLSIEEVAEALGVSESAVKMRIKRGLEQLREETDADQIRLMLS
ncbi:MAG: RNA polymerase sigma factor [Deltaproteobacteria bacterium]|nr:RNA polymerase sigma factor [Deltaproteobacteria bacterium]